jgi:RsiW-degrading membrane proteinase PrsW (M82 family)
MEFNKKWGIMTKATVIMFILIVPRVLIDYFGLDVVPVNTVVGAFISGAIFTIAIIFTGTFTDFKESEKFGGDLAAALKALYNDSFVLPLADEGPARVFRTHVRDLHSTINKCFDNNTWNLTELNHEMNKINLDIRTLSYANVAPPLIAKLRNELGAIDRMTNRIDVIIRTDFIPAAYALAEVATGGVILLLLFMKMDPFIEGIIIFAVIVTMLIGLLLLIRDMDNPFEFGVNTYADVDRETLVYLVSYFDEQDAEMKKLYQVHRNS